MHFLFKTSYAQDIALFKHNGQRFWYGLLLLGLAAAPWLLNEYALSQFTFIGIYAVVCLGLMLLSGFTGLVSLGHAGFLAMGAYTEAWLAPLRPLRERPPPIDSIGRLLQVGTVVGGSLSASAQVVRASVRLTGPVR